MRRFAALFSGFVTAMVVAMIVQTLSLRLQEVPEGLDPKDLGARQALVDAMSSAALWVVVASYLLGGLVGSLGACFMARESYLRMCGVICTSLLIINVMSMQQLHYPTWFNVAVIAGLVVTIPVAKFFADRWIPKVQATA
ncbi:MAG: hypothetical protein R3E96_11170 [Planctomycetota bacterium]